MQTYDVKRERRDLYAPGSGDFTIVEVPPMWFLMVDGRGDPNTSAAYREAVTGLYTLSYAVRAVTRSRLGRVHTVAPPWRVCGRQSTWTSSGRATRTPGSGR